MSAAGLAIFVKTPALSPVKTRLWPHIGQRRAEAFHLAAAAAVASVARRAQARCGIEACWAVAEAEALRGALWSDLPRVGQGEGTLGARMHHVYAQLRRRHAAVVLIGADAPQVTAPVLVRAAQWLAAPAPRLVIGKAGDGGFWLFGGNVALPETAWTRVVYSKPATALDFMQSMQAHGSFLEVDPLDDVDTFADIAPALAGMESLADPTDAQRRLAQLLREVMACQDDGP
jgi:glycosyltransferase A (GT-A) superfamily protein (DUF2064 family)